MLVFWRVLFFWLPIQRTSVCSHPIISSILHTCLSSVHQLAVYLSSQLFIAKFMLSLLQVIVQSTITTFILFILMPSHPWQSNSAADLHICTNLLLSIPNSLLISSLHTTSANHVFLFSVFMTRFCCQVDIICPWMVSILSPTFWI